MLRKLEFKLLIANNYTYYNIVTKIIIIIYINNLFIVKPPGFAFNKLKSNLSKKLDIEDLGEILYFLGVYIIYNCSRSLIYLY